MQETARLHFLHVNLSLAPCVQATGRDRAEPWHHCPGPGLSRGWSNLSALRSGRAGGLGQGRGPGPGTQTLQCPHQALEAQPPPRNSDRKWGGRSPLSTGPWTSALSPVRGNICISFSSLSVWDLVHHLYNELRREKESSPGSSGRPSRTLCWEGRHAHRFVGRGKRAIDISCAI